MGSSSLKKVEEDLEKKYKPLRKYYDPVFGETTILMDRATRQKYAKTEKIILASDQLTHYIRSRANTRQEALVDIKEMLRVPVDICSGNEMHIFIMEYSNSTLYQEMLARSAQQKFWELAEIVGIMFLTVSAVRILNKAEPRKVVISNSCLLYFGEGKVKAVESIFCDRLDSSDLLDFPLIQTDNLTRELYLSPEAYEYLCRKEVQRAKEVAVQEPSVVFAIGMNFLELALLADLSSLYNKDRRDFDFAKLKEALKSVQGKYGKGVYKLLACMLEADPQKRPQLGTVEQNLRSLFGNQ